MSGTMTLPMTTRIEPYAAPAEDVEQWKQSSESVPFASQWELDAVKSVLRTSNLRQDWDSYGSPPPTRKALAISLLLLRDIARFGFDDLPVPHAAPVPGGGLQLEWRAGGREAELEILPDGRIEFLIAEGGALLDEGPLIGPERALRLLSWIASAK